MASSERERRMLAEIQASMEAGCDAGVIRVHISDDELRGNTIRVQGRDLVNFGSCSYLGLGQDPRLIDAAVAAVRRFGPSYSSSAAYASVDLYEELEALLVRIFDGKPVVPAPTTTLAHLAALPVLIHADDAVVIDIQAHASLRLAVDVLRGRGITIKTVRHNDVRSMGTAVERLARSHHRVWLLVDGVYSMYGDTAPIEQIEMLMHVHPKLHVYFDDAHGFGWSGPSGRGVVLDRMEMNDRMVVAVSLSKAFGAGGGALVFPDHKLASTVLHTGGTLTFGGPIHPAVLGAALESASVLLSPEFDERNDRLIERIDLVNSLVRRLRLPSPALERTPITFVEIGSTEQAIRMAKIMMMNGYYVNVSAYPVVPKGRGGLRFTVTADHTAAEIDGLLTTLAQYVHLPRDVDLHDLEEGVSVA